MRCSSPPPHSAAAPSRRRLTRRAAAILLLGCALTACGPDEPRVVRAAREKILLVGNGTEPKSLDPHVTTGVTEHHVLMALMEGLTSEHPSEERVEPAVARSWESNEALDVWTFHLRPEARWSNGDPLTAQDFVFAYHRMLSPRMGSQYAEMLYLMKGAAAFHKGEITDFSEVGVRALDDHTLQISLVGPTPYFPEVLPHYAWYPVHAPTILKFGDMDQRISRWTHPGNFVGNGPFILTQWRFKHFLEVRKNPHYWDVDTVRLDGIRFFPIDNTAAEERMFRDGQLHLTQIIPLDKIPWWRDNHPEVFVSHPYLSVYFYRLNTTRPPLDDPRVRHALSLAIDRQAICEGVLKAGQPPARGMVPPVAGYQGPQPLEFDPERARRLLAEAGYPEGRGFPRLDILINVMESHKTLAEVIQQMWKKHLNIQAGINSQDWSVYLDSMSRLDYDVCRAGWTADYADPMTFLDMWTTGNGNNLTGWSSARFDGLIDEARRTGRTEDRFGVLHRAESLLLEDLPVLPLYFYVRYYLVSPLVTGHHPKLLDNHPWKYVGLKDPHEAEIPSVARH